MALVYSCVDPESFVRDNVFCLHFFFLVDKGKVRPNYHYERCLNGVSLAGR